MGTVRIEPKIGEKVLFYPSKEECMEIIPSHGGYCDATIINVYENGYAVSLIVNDVVGKRHVKTNVLFVQEGKEMEELEEDVSHARYAPSATK